MIMKWFTATLMLLIFSANGFSTVQVRDRVVFNNDTLYFFDAPNFIESPLEQIDDISEKIRSEIFDEIWVFNSSCWRGFFAKWKIKDNTLYLSKVFDCSTISDIEINAVIEKILGRRFENGLMKADWVNGTFGIGTNFGFRPILDISIYQDYMLLIENGKIIDIEQIEIKRQFFQIIQ